MEVVVGWNAVKSDDDSRFGAAAIRTATKTPTSTIFLDFPSRIVPKHYESTSEHDDLEKSSSCRPRRYASEIKIFCKSIGEHGISGLQRHIGLYFLLSYIILLLYMRN